MAVGKGKAGEKGHGHKGAGKTKSNRSGPAMKNDVKEARVSKKHGAKTKKMKGGRIPS